MGRREPCGFIKFPNLPSPQPPNVEGPSGFPVSRFNSRIQRGEDITSHVGSFPDFNVQSMVRKGASSTHLYIPTSIPYCRTQGAWGEGSPVGLVVLFTPLFDLPPFTSRGGSFPDFGLNVMVRKGIQFLQIHISVPPFRTAGRTSTRGREVLPHSIHLPPLPQSF